MQAEVTFPETPTDSANVLWVGADRLRLLGAVEGAPLELIEVEVPPGSGTPPHRHPSCETFYIIEGTLTLRRFPDGAPPQTVSAGPGTTSRVASMEGHNYSNESGGPVRMLVLVEPSMTAFFRAAGSDTAGGEPDFARIGAAMARHGVSMIDMAP